MTELDEMVVRLTGDGSEYMKMLNDASTATRTHGAEIGKVTSEVKSHGDQLKGFASTVLGVLGSIGVAAGWSTIFGQFTRAESGMVRLRSAIRQNGGDVEASINEFTQYAQSIANVTTTSKGAVLGMLAQGTQLGLTNEQAERAVRTSIALAEVNQDEAESHMHAAIQLEKGHAMHVAMALGMGREGAAAADLGEIYKRLGQNFQTAQDLANTTEGKLTRLGNSMKGLFKEMGGVVAEFVTPVIEGIQEAVNWFKALNPEVKTTITIIAGLVSGVMALGPVLAVVGSLLAGMFSPFTIAVGIAGGLLAGWVTTVGGIAPAMKIVKDKMAEAFAFLRPLITPAKELLFEMWDGVKTVFGMIADTISTVWSNATKGSVVTWDMIRDALRESIWNMEFNITHLGDHWDIIWLRIKLTARETFDWLRDAFTGVVAQIGSLNYALGEGAARSLHAGRNPFSDFSANMQREFDRITAVMGGGDLSAAAALRSRLTSLQSEMRRGWEVFRDNKIADSVNDEILASLEEGGTTANEFNAAGREDAKEYAKGLTQFDAALVGSGEAIKHLQEYMDMLDGVEKGHGHGRNRGQRGQSPGGVDVPAMVGGGEGMERVPALGGPNDPRPGFDRIAEVLAARLNTINEHLATIANNTAADSLELEILGSL